jgi:hypothetical protein
MIPSEHRSTLHLRIQINTDVLITNSWVVAVRRSPSWQSAAKAKRVSIPLPNPIPRSHIKARASRNWHWKTIARVSGKRADVSHVWLPEQMTFPERIAPWCPYSGKRGGSVSSGPDGVLSPLNEGFRSTCASSSSPGPNSQWRARPFRTRVQLCASQYLANLPTRHPLAFTVSFPKSHAWLMNDARFIAALIIIWPTRGQSFIKTKGCCREWHCNATMTNRGRIIQGHYLPPSSSPYSLSIYLSLHHSRPSLSCLAHPSKGKNTSMLE